MAVLDQHTNTQQTKHTTNITQQTNAQQTNNTQTQHNKHMNNKQIINKHNKYTNAE